MYDVNLHGRIRVENRLKHHREAKGWSQGELARRLGVSRQTINAVETDKYDPSLPLALRMSRLFGVAVPDLFIDPWEPEDDEQD
ncbi:helix-turn-helix transcriptional regulator [Erythrobacter sp. WG]|uniref:helix-turn-helix transcriptional regulator n=1 Tax=Erythrobacter sp. WG TaxID=2985510 RepID=UPI00227043BF|nr:helix-turn-helix transcriptional regulator [Erythrobacter sp. WG]